MILGLLLLQLLVNDHWKLILRHSSQRNDTVTVRIQGEGPIGYLVGEADAKGNVRAI